MGRATRLAFTVLALVALQACGNSAPAQPSAVQGGTVKLLLPGDWPSFDIQNLFNPSIAQIAWATTDRMVAVGPKGPSDLVPYLAKSWKASPSSITFTVRTGLTCNDGSALTATGIAASFKRLLDPKTGSTQVPRIFGPGPFTVTADNSANTLTIATATPWADLLSGFTHPVTGVLCPAALQNPSSIPNKFISSGPYNVTNAVHGSSVSMSLRPEWAWGPAGTTAKTLGLPSQLIMQILANTTTAANEITTGGLDIGFLTGADANRLANDKTLKHTVAQGPVPFPIYFNHDSSKITSDPMVRKAIMQVVDRQAWNVAANFGHGVLSSSFISPEAECFDPGTAKLLPAYSTTDAMATLKADGYTADSSGKLTKNGKTLDITILSYASTNNGPEYLGAQLNKIGINTKVDIVELVTFTTRLIQGQFDVAAPTITAVIGTPAYAYSAYYGLFPPRGANFGLVPMRPTMETELQAALSSSGQSSCQQWASFQEELLKNYDYIPLAVPTFDFYSRNIQFTPVGQLLEPYSLRRVR